MVLLMARIVDFLKLGNYAKCMEDCGFNDGGVTNLVNEHCLRWKCGSITKEEAWRRLVGSLFWVKKEGIAVSFLLLLGTLQSFLQLLKTENTFDSFQKSQKGFGSFQELPKKLP
jgi:hypothetical protein